MRTKAAAGLGLLAAIGLFAAGALHDAQAAAPNAAIWRRLDPEDTLYIDTAGGRIVIELFPELAPKHVARVKELTREKFYNGLLFHRVIDRFMAQGGDPAGDGSGGSSKPDLPGEFMFRRGPDMPFVPAAAQGNLKLGFYKTMPVATQPDELMSMLRDGKVSAWGLHCPGVASMARESDPDTANSQFFLMRAAYPSLDKRYTIWGRVVWGQEAVLKLAVGEPPAAPDKMLAVHVAADMPERERAPIYVMRVDSPDFRAVIDKARAERGADFSVCDIEIPTRVGGEKTQEQPREQRWWKKIPLVN